MRKGFLKWNNPGGVFHPAGESEFIGQIENGSNGNISNTCIVGIENQPITLIG